MSTLIPTTTTDADDGGTVGNDGWYPDLSLSDLADQTGQPDIFEPARLRSALLSAMIEVNASVAPWRAAQTAATLADIPAPLYGGQSEKVILYMAAVYARARAVLLRETRDFDSTKDGHDRADKLEAVAGDYLRQSAESLARMTGRPRMTVELI